MFYDCKLNSFGFWTVYQPKQDIWRRHLGNCDGHFPPLFTIFSHFCHTTKWQSTLLAKVFGYCLWWSISIFVRSLYHSYCMTYPFMNCILWSVTSGPLTRLFSSVYIFFVIIHLNYIRTEQLVFPSSLPSSPLLSLLSCLAHRSTCLVEQRCFKLCSWRTGAPPAAETWSNHIKLHENIICWL